MKRYILAGAAALALTVASAPAALAQEETPEYGVTTSTVTAGADCGTATVTWTNPTEWAFFGDYRVGDETGTDDEVTGMTIAEGPLEGAPFGQTYNLTDVPAGETVTATVTVADGTEPVEVSAWVKRGPEQRSYSASGPVAITPCAPEPQPQPGDECTLDGVDGTLDDELVCVPPTDGDGDNPPADGDGDQPPAGGGDNPPADDGTDNGTDTPADTGTDDAADDTGTTTDDGVVPVDSTDTSTGADTRAVDELAYTGAPGVGLLVGIGAGALLLGGGALLLTRKLRRQ